MVFRQNVLRVVLCPTHNINKAKTEGTISALRQVALMPTEQERKEPLLFLFFWAIGKAQRNRPQGVEKRGCLPRPQAILGGFLIGLSSALFDFVDDAF